MSELVPIGDAVKGRIPAKSVVVGVSQNSVDLANDRHTLLLLKFAIVNREQCVDALIFEALMRIADRCVQCMGGQGVTADTIVEQIFREVRAFRIYDGPTEVHKWSLAKTIKRDWQRQQGS
jgi:hypothetical protein